MKNLNYKEEKVLFFALRSKDFFDIFSFPVIKKIKQNDVIFVNKYFFKKCLSFWDLVLYKIAYKSFLRKILSDYFSEPYFVELVIFSRRKNYLKSSRGVEENDNLHIHDFFHKNKDKLNANVYILRSVN